MRYSSGFRHFTRQSVPTRLPPNKCEQFLSYFAGTRSIAEEQLLPHAVISLLESCPDVQSLRRIHAHIFTSGLGGSILVGSKLLNRYAHFNKLSEARWVVSKIINRNVSLWNSIIVGYFRAGHFGEVLDLYSDSKKQSIGIDSGAVNFSLKSCLELGRWEFGRVIHSDTFKVSLNYDGFVGSSLIGFYAGCEAIEDASRVFEEIPERDIVLYTALVTAYAQAPNFHAAEAFRVASCMQREGLDPNRVTLVSLLQAAGQIGGLQEGRSVHAYAIRRGLNRFDEVLESSLLDMYVKCGDPKTAEYIFSQCEKQSVASWNLMISGLVKFGEALEAVKLFAIMERKNLEPDLITISNALMACANLKCCHWGSSIHGYVIRNMGPLDLVATTSLIDMYSKCNRTDKAKILFENMKQRDVISCNVTIAGCLCAGLANDAFKIFGGMVGEGTKPNSATMLNILSACGDLRDRRKGRWIHGYVVRRGFDSDVEVSNQMVHMYARCGSLENAKSVFKSIIEKDLVSWTSMMMGYVYHGHADEAIELFFQMREARVDPDSITLLSLLDALSQLGCLKRTKEVHGFVQRNHLGQETSVMNALVTTYSKCGRLDMSSTVFNTIIGKDRASWNAIIAGNSMHGSCIDALQHFYQMQEQNMRPDEMTFSSILSACSHTGLMEEGISIFRSMQAKYLIMPKEEHYSSMVDLLGRAGRLKEAYDLVKSSPLGQSISALTSLVAACKVHGDTDLGEVIGKELLHLEPKSSGAYALVASMYADTGRWDEVEDVWNTAMQRGLRKNPGYSLVESNEQSKCNVTY